MSQNLFRNPLPFPIPSLKYAFGSTNKQQQADTSASKIKIVPHSPPSPPQPKTRGFTAKGCLKSNCDRLGRLYDKLVTSPQHKAFGGATAGNFWFDERVFLKEEYNRLFPSSFVSNSHQRTDSCPTACVSNLQNFPPNSNNGPDK
eukprot:TRINITY_DN11862_c0_g1_i1.p1 TRINITY_DN11862_c0_g1~~TRINITY_DN11862_c0_g1_i1.p1  ORF type:complete len:145 (-),score=25.79 TRINITY_DN11862_c0_g1_i1:191-625(-)